MTLCHAVVIPPFPVHFPITFITAEWPGLFWEWACCTGVQIHFSSAAPSYITLTIMDSSNPHPKKHDNWFVKSLLTALGTLNNGQHP